MKFPEEYRTDIFVQKFEKDFINSTEYTFIGAYPISINSMPISYDSSQLLKCTVSFSYIRYFMNNSVTLSTKNTPEIVVDDSGQFGQTGFNLNQNSFGPSGPIIPQSTSAGNGPIPLQVIPFRDQPLF